MLNFFRNIRRQILSVKKLRMPASPAGRYLIYAGGEILLVVIGILIALQINTWNENRKNAIKEVQYLTAFKADLEANRDELERVMFLSKATRASADSILKKAVREIDHIDVRRINEFLLRATAYTIFVNQNGTVREVLESGDLRIIKNDTLRTFIATWETLIDEIRSYETPDTENAKLTLELTQKYIDVYKRNFGGPIMDEQMIRDLFTDRDYLNAVYGRIFHTTNVYDYYEQQLSRIETILQVLERDLSQKK